MTTGSPSPIFACGLILLAMACMGLAMLMGGCAAPPKPIPIRIDSGGYRACVESCPDGEAFVIENAHDIACFCRKRPEGT